jgi:hypothetical protein
VLNNLKDSKEIIGVTGAPPYSQFRILAKLLTIKKTGQKVFL